jgi:hypothetical protein
LIKPQYYKYYADIMSTLCATYSGSFWIFFKYVLIAMLIGVFSILIALYQTCLTIADEIDTSFRSSSTVPYITLFITFFSRIGYRIFQTRLSITFDGSDFWNFQIGINIKQPVPGEPYENQEQPADGIVTNGGSQYNIDQFPEVHQLVEDILAGVRQRQISINQLRCYR